MPTTSICAARSPAPPHLVIQHPHRARQVRRHPTPSVRAQNLPSTCLPCPRCPKCPSGTVQVQASATSEAQPPTSPTLPTPLILQALSKHTLLLQTTIPLISYTLPLQETARHPLGTLLLLTPSQLKPAPLSASHCHHRILPILIFLALALANSPKPACSPRLAMAKQGPTPQATA